MYLRFILYFCFYIDFVNYYYVVFKLQRYEYFLIGRRLWITFRQIIFPSARPPDRPKVDPDTHLRVRTVESGKRQDHPRHQPSPRRCLLRPHLHLPHHKKTDNQIAHITPNTKIVPSSPPPRQALPTPAVALFYKKMGQLSH